ncbi:MAG: XylR family transcriptional regulator [Phycisphaeraceae bacterium]|nr:XylR family transcriptional regulator [Phycisphaeraceae bacterium]
MRRLNVVVHVDSSGAYGRGILRGVSKFAQKRSRWVVHGQPSWDATNLLRPEVDAIIVQAADPTFGQMLKDSRHPVVNVADNYAPHHLPTVISDNLEIGRKVAEHFLARGFTHFGFLGEMNQWWAQGRQEGFLQALKPLKVPIEERWCQNSHHAGELRDWLKQLRHPLALMACNDVWARQGIENGLQAGLRVPEDLAVVGVDNDDLVCELCQIHISSVAVATERIGFEAAALLDRIIDGETAPPPLTLIPPQGVITRRSSDTLAISDAEVIRAVRFIAQHACNPITVTDVVKEIRLSRRRLEQRFQVALGRTPADEIRRHRLEKAKRLLEATDIPLGQIAMDSGFTDAPRLSKVFRRELGMTPSQYRNRNRVKSSE